jgi:hypothetical protein
MPSLPDLGAEAAGGSSEQLLMDYYALMFTETVSQELQQLQTPEAATSGVGFLQDQGIINELQWLVFCASHLTGGIASGGVWDGLLGNQPKLVADCVPLLRRLGLANAAERFALVFAPILELQARVRQSLQLGASVNMEQYWDDWQTAEGKLNDDDVESFERDFLGEYGASAPTLKSEIEDAAISLVHSARD